MISLLKEYLVLSDKQLFKRLKKELEQYYSNIKVDKRGGYIYAEGNIPIVLVAHLDTVFPYKKNMNIYYDNEQKVMWSPDGLGTDDRAGVLMIMWLLQDNPNLRPSILFTMGEETDLSGAYYASMLKIKPNFVIELDRKGRGESVYYQCDNKDFEKYINDFGFTTQIGSYTDLALLCPVWGCAGVNLSVGYYNEHSYSELWKVDDFLFTYYRVVKILNDNPIEHNFQYIPKGRTNEKKT